MLSRPHLAEIERAVGRLARANIVERDCEAAGGGAIEKDSTFYAQIAELLGPGLITAQDDTWKRQRRIIQPVFTARTVDSYAVQMNDGALKLVDSWRRTGVSEIDLGDQMMRVTLRIVVRLFFGEDADEMVRSAFRFWGGLYSRAAHCRLRLHWVGRYRVTVASFPRGLFVPPV